MQQLSINNADVKLCSFIFVCRVHTTYQPAVLYYWLHQVQRVQNKHNHNLGGFTICQDWSVNVKHNQ